MLPRVGDVARASIGMVLAGTTAYLAWDMAGDAAIYATTKRRVLEAAEAHKRVRERLGSPLRAGPWYDATVVLGHYGHSATVTFPLRGSETSSDAIVKMVRRGGFASSTMFSLFQGNEWEVMIMDVAVGMGPGGRPIVMSLLEPEAPFLDQSGHGHKGGKHPQ